MIRKALAVLVGGLLLGADEPKKDEDKIQDTWSVVSLEKGGQKEQDEKARAITMVFADGKITIKHDGKEMEATYQLDAAKKPKHITVVAEGKTHNGIYALDGDDLKMCLGAENVDDRPTEFASKEGTKTLLVVLKRDKK